MVTNGPTWLEGVGHASLDLGGGEALEGVRGELEEEEVPLEDLDCGAYRRCTLCRRERGHRLCKPAMMR